MSVTDNQMYHGGAFKSRNVMRLGNCTRCGEHKLVGPLHLDKGGPEVCLRCGSDLHTEMNNRKRDQDFWLKRFMGDGSELYQDVLEDAVRLTHPDKHPPERTELATRVTQELLKLRPFLKPRPKPVSSVIHAPATSPTGRTDAPPRNDSVNAARERNEEALRKLREMPKYPCDSCRHTAPMYYCNLCREKWEDIRRKESEHMNKMQRLRRLRCKLARPATVCLGCGNKFKGRKDAKHCSAACRVKAFRRKLVV